MKDSPTIEKVLQQLTSWDKPTYKRFIKFAQSPYFNSRSVLADILLFLKPYHPHFERHDIYKIVPPNISQSSNHPEYISKRFSDLNQLLKRFLQQQILEEDESVQSYARQLYHRRFTTYEKFKQECLQEIDRLSTVPVIDVDSLAHLSTISRRLYNHPEYTNSSDYLQFNQQIIDYSDALYILINLKYLVNQRVKQKRKNDVIKHPFENHIVERAENLFDQYPLIQFYSNLLHLFNIQYDTSITEEELKGMLLQMNRLLPVTSNNESSFALAKLSSLSIRAYMKEPEIFGNWVLKIYQLGDKYNTYQEEGSISDLTYFNVIVIAGVQGAFDWAYDFIEKHIHHFPEARRTTASNLSKAILLFYLGEYQAAFSLLGVSSKKKMVYELRIRTLDLQCQLGYHLEANTHLKPLLSQRDNFKKMIYRRKNISIKRPYINFANAVYEIANLRSFHWDHPNFNKKLNDIINKYAPMHMEKVIRQQVKRARGQSS